MMSEESRVELSPEYVQLISEYKESRLCQSRGHPPIARYMLEMMPIDAIQTTDPYDIADMLVEQGYCHCGVPAGRSRANIRYRVSRFQEFLRERS